MRIIIVLALIGAAHALPRKSNRITGGESTTIENYPFMANMLFYWMGKWNQECGGTLITSTAVVSAAHCFDDEPHFRLQVRLGSTNSSSGGNVHTISRIILHEQFNTTLALNDVAVVRLTNPAVFSNQINVARIAGLRYILPDNTLVHAIGWGHTTFLGNSSEDLQHVAVNVINHQICTERYSYLKKILGDEDVPQVTPEMFCTGIVNVGGKDACQGDSGGPIIHNGDVLVGITSWGFICGSKIFPGINVRVSSYTDWIYTNSIN